MFVTIFAGSYEINTFLVQAHQAYGVDLEQAINDKALYGQAFLNLTNTPIVRCFEYCVKHCFCTTFQICHKTDCMLLSSNRFLTPSSLLPMLGCIYYDMKPRKQASSVTSCCLNTVLIHLISFLLASCFILYDFVIIFLFVFRFM